MSISVIILDSDAETSTSTVQNHGKTTTALPDKGDYKINGDIDVNDDNCSNIIASKTAISRNENYGLRPFYSEIVEIEDDSNDVVDNLNNNNSSNYNNINDNDNINNNVSLHFNDIHSSFHSDIICLDGYDDNCDCSNEFVINRPANRPIDLNIYPSSPQNPNSSLISINESVSSIVLNSIPSPFPELKHSKRLSNNIDLSSSQSKKPKLAERSSSIGSITLPKSKPRILPTSNGMPNNGLIGEESLFQAQSQEVFNMHNTNTENEHSRFPTENSRRSTITNSVKEMGTSTAQTSRSSTNSYMDKPSKNILSDITDINSSLDEINNDSLDLINEVDKMRKQMELQRRQKSKNVKNFLFDLNQLRNNPSNESSEIINSSVHIINEEPENRFVDSVTDDVIIFSNQKLEELLERANNIDSENLKLVNKAKYSKDELIEQITCLISPSLHEKFTELNEDYVNLFKPLKIEVAQEQLLPVIQFKRFIKAVFYEKKKVFVPITPRFVNEDYYLLIYRPHEILDLFYKGILKKHINTIKRKNSNANISVWIIGFDVFMKNVKNKVQRLSVENVRGNLDDTLKTKKNTNLEDLVHPEHIRQRFLKYEVKYDIKFQKFLGLLELAEWLVSFSYTLSSKHVDHLERNQKYSNIGKIKSASNPKDCIIQMVSQIKGLTEQRAKAFVEKYQYNCVGDLYNDLSTGTDYKSNGSLRSDHEKMLKKVFLSKNEDDLV